MAIATKHEPPATADKTQPVVHTPGPWKYNECEGREGEIVFHTIDAAGRHVASTWAGPNLGDARLIAASPQLLAALIRAVETIKEWHGNCAWDLYQQSPEMMQINYAIQKATGLVV